MNKRTYEAAFYQCYLCGETERLIPYDNVAVCEHCETTAEFWLDNPVTATPVEYCPACGSKRVERGWTDVESAEFDEERAQELHPADTEDDWMFGDEYWRFTYVYECVHCEGCQEDWPYEPRWYYNPVDNAYTAQRPMNEADKLRAEHAAAIAAGQLRLFEVEDY